MSWIRLRVWMSLAALALSLVPAAHAAERQGAVDFARDVYPILQRSCLECHGAEKQRGKLRLDTRPAALRGGVSGPAVVPGQPGQSELYRRLTLHQGDPEAMPARGASLTAGQVAMVRDWISQGAIWPGNIQLARHWAYRPPTLPALPAVNEPRWPRTPIDRFVLARLEREGLRPSPAADPAALLRRVYLDLIGLPPSPAEADRFLADSRPDAYERLVDRLLASPQFGERWARPWLDLARYADSHGFQRDDLHEIWAYRDWVIRALNEDMPFDRFTLEQLAGDLLPDATEPQRVATGFNRCAPTNVEAGSEPEETRVNQIIDRVNTTAAVWLGTTLECAQCHDHKYDPFTQKDYYGLFAYFNGTAIEADRSNPKVPGSIRFLGPTMPLEDPTTKAERGRLGARLRTLDAQLAARRQELGADLDAWLVRLADSVADAPQTHPLEVADFESSAGSPHRILEDRSVLLVDDPPDRDTYTVTVRTSLRDITGFRLEALTDPSLPGSGPGRGDARRPNFVLNHFAVTAAPSSGARPAGPVQLRAARASFSQKGFDVARAIDADAKTAWAINPQFHKDHWAVFETDGPIGFADGTDLTFTLVQDYGAGRTIGRLRLLALTGTPRDESLPADIVKLLQTPAAKRPPAQRQRLADFRLGRDPVGARLRTERAQTERALQALRPPTSLVMQELPRMRETFVFARGDYRSPVGKVQPAVPAILPPAPAGPANRLTLARWLTARNNPLTARVQVNRLWAELFGRGIVATVEDFGVRGEPPTHPGLLDWLAVHFMDSGWSMKQVLRTIVLSATYRQSSRLSAELQARDDQNRLLARGPRFRMDAEMIRDNLLAAAGLLRLKQGGPPIRPYQPDGLWTKVGGARVEYIVSPPEDRYRRGVYVVWKRASPYPSFMAFDASARLACTVKRSRSNTPLQALALLNDPVYVEAAMTLAARVLTERAGSSLDDQLRYAFRVCLVREPGTNEVAVLRRLYASQRAAAAADPQATTVLLGSFARPGSSTPPEFAAWYAVAAALLNLDEAITKG